MTLSAHLRQLAADLGFPELAKTSGPVEFEFDGFVRCSFEAAADDRRLLMFASLLTVSPDDASDLLEYLLLESGPATACDGTSFAIDAARDQVVFQGVYEPAGDAAYGDLANAVERFVAQAKERKAALARGDWRESPRVDDQPPPQTGPLMRV